MKYMVRGDCKENIHFTNLTVQCINSNKGKYFTCWLLFYVHVCAIPMPEELEILEKVVQIVSTNCVSRCEELGILSILLKF